MSSTATPAADASPVDPPLRRNRDFATLLISQSVSAGGDAVSATALPLLVLALTGSGVAMGIVGAVNAGADFFMGTVAGALADRGDRKAMMFLADLGRAILTALIPLSVMLNGPTMAVIVVVTAPMAILRAFFRAGYLAAMPNLVGRSQLAKGNGVLEIGMSTAFILGPVIAGLLVTVIGPGETLALDAASFAISSLGLFLIKRELKAPADRPPSRVIDDIREGIDYVARHRILRTVILLFAGVSAMLAPIGAAMTFRIVRDLGESPGAFGLAITGIGVGTIVGSLIATRLGAGTNVARVLIVSVIVLGCTTALTGIVPSLAGVIALNAISGAGEAVLVVVYVSVRAAYSPEALVGRIASTARVMALGLQPLGALIGGVLIDVLGGSATLVVFGAGICALALAFVPIAALRSASMTPSASPPAPNPPMPIPDGLER